MGDSAIITHCNGPLTDLASENPTALLRGGTMRVGDEILPTRRAKRAGA